MNVQRRWSEHKNRTEKNEQAKQLSSYISHLLVG